jgi:rubrerythrin
MTYEIWICRSCGWEGVLPEREDEDDFSCPECCSHETHFEKLIEAA